MQVEDENESDWSSVSEEDRLADRIQNMRQGDRRQHLELLQMPLEALTDDDSCVVCYESFRSMTQELLQQSKSGVKVAVQCISCQSQQCMECLAEWAVQTINQLFIPENFSIKADGAD